MAENVYQQAIFSEIDQAADAIEKLRDLGIKDEEMEVTTGMPFSHHILGRPEPKTRIPLYSILGFFLGLIVSLAFNFGTPLLYPVYVGGKPLLPVPTTLLLTFEFCMLFMMVFTFLGVIWESGFPKIKPIEYSRSVSEGKITLIFKCPPQQCGDVKSLLLDMGAESAGDVEVLA